MDLGIATQLFRPAPGWKPPLQRLADEIVREYVNPAGSAHTNVHKVLECERELPGEL